MEKASIPPEVVVLAARAELLADLPGGGWPGVDTC